MLAIALAVRPRAKSQRNCQRLRSTGSFVLRQRPPRSSTVRCGVSRMRRAISPFYNSMTRRGITLSEIPKVGRDDCGMLVGCLQFVRAIDVTVRRLG